MKRLLILLLSFFIFCQCKKEENKCEKWKVHDYCIALSPAAFCTATRDLTLTFCNEDDLADAHAGRETILFESNDIRQMRQYVQRVY